MPFENKSIQNILSDKLKDNEFKEAYDNVKNEYKIIEQIMCERKRKKLSQKQLAHKANVTQQAISRLEKEKHIPNLGTLLKIVHGLNLELVLVEKDHVIK